MQDKTFSGVFVSVLLGGLFWIVWHGLLPAFQWVGRFV